MSEADRIIEEIRKADTLEVSEKTAELLYTGRTGHQPRDWFLNLLGNRIGRTDRRVNAALAIVRAQAAGQALTLAQVDTMIAEADGS